MTNKFEIFSKIQRVEKAKDTDELFIEGMASTTGMDRAGDVILAEAWRKGGLTNYKLNPILLYNHNWDKPIGKAVDIEARDDGLFMRAKISPAAADNVYSLIKDGVLGTFSVSFLVKDADYKPETDGFVIKDAELLENSVVTIPMNQAATFSIAKSFNSEKDYEDFKLKFTKSDDQTDQGKVYLKTDEGYVPFPTTDTTITTSSGGITRKSNLQEIEMDKPETNLDVVKQAAREAALEFAVEQAKQKAAKEAAEKDAAEKARREEEQASKILALENNTDKLVKDLREELQKKEANMAEVMDKFKKDIEEKAKEIADMRNSKRVFDDRLGSGDVRQRIKAVGKELMHAHFYNIITGKSWGEGFAKQVLEKGGIDYTTNAPDLDQEIQDNIQKEITVWTRVADQFREIQVNGAATVLPFQSDVGLAEWKIADTTGNLENNPLDSAGAANEYRVGQVTMNAYRLVSSTYMDNDLDEQILVNVMPMLVEGVARAHARAVESTLLNGGGSISGLATFAAEGADIAAVSAAGALTGANLLAARALMGKFGLNPSDLVYFVNQDEYYSLLQDSAFQNLNEVGDMATKIKGIIGAVYGTPVIVSDEFPAVADTAAGAFVVNTRNYVIPRLRGVRVEQDYQVWEQRRVIVASQSLGFTEIQAGSTGVFEPSIKLTYSA